jgi:hypothetical protein
MFGRAEGINPNPPSDSPMNDAAIVWTTSTNSSRGFMQGLTGLMPT